MENFETLDYTRLIGQEKRFQLVETVGDLEIAAKNMSFSGYVSTSAPDLANEIVLPSAFKKHIHAYRKNPVYCYNHDQRIPIGKVLNVDITDKGLYLDDVTLSDIPIVRDVIWPLIQDGVLKQQSIGFYSLDGEWDNKTKNYVHTEVYMLESSIVTIACNPQAEIDAIKTIPGFEKYNSLEKLMRDHDRGKFRLPSEISTKFAINNNPLANEDSSNKENSIMQNNIIPCAVTVEVKALHDIDGVEVSKPNKSDSNYDEVSSLIHAGKKGDKYVFQIGVPTEKGFKYVWDKVVVAFYKLLGARNTDNISDEEREGLLTTIKEAYYMLGKQFPDLSILNGNYDKAYSKVEFKEAEKEIFEAHEVKASLEEVKNIVNSYEECPDSIKEQLKEFYAVISVYGIVETPKDAEIAQEILGMITEEEEPEMEEVGAYAGEKKADSITLTQEELNLLLEFVKISKKA